MVVPSSFVVCILLRRTAQYVVHYAALWAKVWGIRYVACVRAQSIFDVVFVSLTLSQTHAQNLTKHTTPNDTRCRDSLSGEAQWHAADHRVADALCAAAATSSSSTSTTTNSAVRRCCRYVAMNDSLIGFSCHRLVLVISRRRHRRRWRSLRSKRFTPSSSVTVATNRLTLFEAFCLMIDVVVIEFRFDFLWTQRMIAVEFDISIEFQRRRRYKSSCRRRRLSSPTSRCRRKVRLSALFFFFFFFAICCPFDVLFSNDKTAAMKKEQVNKRLFNLPNARSLIYRCRGKK